MEHRDRALIHHGGIDPGPVGGSRRRPGSNHRRPATPARREVLREFRERVASGGYEPPIDAVSAVLARGLLRDGLADLEPS